MQKYKIVLIWFISVILLSSVALRTQKPCKIVEKTNGYVCVNHDGYCDNLKVPVPKEDEYVLVTSSKNKERFAYDLGKFEDSSDSKNCKTAIEIDQSQMYQKMRGFGGAYTASVASLMNRLSPNMKKCVYKSYFSKTSGAAYSYLRVPIGGADFDSIAWAYNEYPENDMYLTNFTRLDDRDIIRNAQLKEMMCITKNKDVQIMGATWGPPKWMKEKNNWGGGLDNLLKKEYYQAWANYHLRWLQLMSQDKMNVFAVSTGNEPWTARNIGEPSDVLAWTPEDQAVWIANNLGPTLKNSEFSDVEIHGFDDNREVVSEWLEGMKKGDDKAFKALSAIDFHAYSDNGITPLIIDQYQAEFPDKEMWYTEMCFGAFFMTKYTGPRLGAWGRAEQLSKILIQNLNHFVVGYLDWNIVLDSSGGPSYTTNSLDAPIIFSEDMTEMYKQPIFYVMAHFSKFIPAGSVRIDAKISGCKSDKLLTVAFLQPDDKVTVIIYNTAQRSVGLTVDDTSKGKININLKAKSINTLVYANGCKSSKSKKKGC